MLVWLLIFGAMNMSHLVRTPIYGLIIVLTVGFSVLTSPLQARVQLDIIAKFRNADVELDVVTVVDSDVEASKSKVALLEPISKSPEEDNEASELYEAEEVLGVVFPTDEDAALPLNPSKEALHEPASHIAAQPSSILRGRPASVAAMRRDHLDAVLAQLLIEWIAVVGAIADQILGLGLDHVEVEAQLYQPNFVVIGGMRADRERQSMTIHDCHDFHAFSALRRSDPRPTTLRHHERRIDEAFRFIQGAFVAKLVGYIHQHSPQNFIAAPGLKAPMNGFVVRIALRQHVPLRAGVEYPQYSFENTSGRDRLASRTSIGDMLFRKMIPDALPLLVCQPNHPTFIADRLRLAILR